MIVPILPPPVPDLPPRWSPRWSAGALREDGLLLEATIRRAPEAASPIRAQWYACVSDGPLPDTYPQLVEVAEDPVWVADPEASLLTAIAAAELRWPFVEAAAVARRETVPPRPRRRKPPKRVPAAATWVALPVLMCADMPHLWVVGTLAGGEWSVERLSFTDPASPASLGGPGAVPEHGHSETRILPTLAAAIADVEDRLGGPRAWHTETTLRLVRRDGERVRTVALRPADDGTGRWFLLRLDVAMPAGDTPDDVVPVLAHWHAPRSEGPLPLSLARARAEVLLEEDDPDACSCVE